MTAKRGANPRLGWLTAALVLLTLVLLGLPDRLLTQWAYALERGRLQADTEELPLADQDLTRLHEVSHAFRLVARIARPGVVHIRAAANSDAAHQMVALEREERQLHRRLEEMARQIEDAQAEDPSLESVRELRQRLAEIRLEMTKQEELARPASASGIVFDEEGRILTNNHVVEGRDTVHVQLPNEREYEATLVGTDPKTDLAMIRIDASELHPLKFGDSDKMEVGDWVIAVGAPFGLSQSVTHGIISATGRNDVLTGRGILYQNFLQTDAAINPGNSGGPLLNLRGEVVGINTAIATNGDAYNAGIAFTIPSNMAVNIANQLKETGEVARGWLGITMGELTAADREIFGVEAHQGVMVAQLIERGPADQAGVLLEDVILTVNGRPVSNMAELRGLIADVYPGQPATFDLIRGGQRATVTVKLGRRPGDAELAASRARVRTARPIDALGLYARTLLPDYAPDLGYDQASRGVLVLGPVEDGAEPADVKQWELIVECDGKPLKTVGTLLRALEEVEKGKQVKLDVVNAAGERRTVRYRRK
ncbi:MAG: trypsin-like peptidase domain-containing protein [Planctomycetes bacterium]|nr:trypsin-like peptidase domain-containing protein [Planctomycetota bacterium]